MPPRNREVAPNKRFTEWGFAGARSSAAASVHPAPEINRKLTVMANIERQLRRGRFGGCDVMSSSVLEWSEKRRRRLVIPVRPVLIWSFLGLAAAMIPYLFAITAGGAYGFDAPVWYGRTFNSMLSHLLAGRFDVDPQTIGNEGVIRGGLVYTYFGVFPALLRLPLLSVTGFPYIDFTRISCVAAVAVMAGFKLLSLETVWRARGTPERRDLLTLFALAILLGGAQIQFLRPSIFQEVILWAGALSAAFVFFVLRGIYSERGFSPGVLTGLAIIAGLCLMTRVSTALGLYIAFGLLWLVLAWRALRDPGRRSIASALAPLIAPAAIVLAFVAAAGFINFMRWGSPLAFTDPQGYLWAMMNAPERMARVEQYGQFNLARIGYMLMYYFCPIWIFRGADGSLLWSAFQQRTIDSIELPPSSFFLSDPLLMALAGFCLVQLFRHKNALNRAVILPVLVGLAVPILLILTFASATFRYRVEFYPLIEFCAFLGLGLLLARPAKPPMRLFAVGAFASICAAYMAWLLYALSPLGSAETVLGNMDAISFYQSMLAK
jgi:hypothetical protein